MIAGGKGLGVVMGDVDLDDDLDLYVANDTTDNFLYLNRGDGVFDEVGQLNGAALDDAGRPTGSMGVDLADFDGDGLPDLWTANYEHEIFGLHRNLGGGRFLHASRSMGFAAIGDRYVGWGTGFADFGRREAAEPYLAQETARDPIRLTLSQRRRWSRQQRPSPLARSAHASGRWHPTPSPLAQG